MIKFYRHGDVNLHGVSALPGTVKLVKKGKYILARGEATGSVHEIDTPSENTLEIYQDEDGTVYCRVLEVGTVTHTHDHETLHIEPGIYKQVQEREVDHFADSIVRRVVD